MCDVHAGQKAYGELRANTLAFKAFSFNMPASNFSEAVPASRALLLRGVHPPNIDSSMWFLAMASPSPRQVIFSHHTPSASSDTFRERQNADLDRRAAHEVGYLQSSSLAPRGAR